MIEVAGPRFGVRGLVESIFGIGKDLSRFETEPVVDRFLEVGKKVLAEDAWEELPKQNKREVIDAMKALGIYFEDLRSRIDVILGPKVVEESAGITDQAVPASSIFSLLNIEGFLDKLQLNGPIGESLAIRTDAISEVKDVDDMRQSHRMTTEKRRR